MLFRFRLLTAWVGAAIATWESHLKCALINASSQNVQVKVIHKFCCSRCEIPSASNIDLRTPVRELAVARTVYYNCLVYVLGIELRGEQM